MCNNGALPHMQGRGTVTACMSKPLLWHPGACKGCKHDALPQRAEQTLPQFVRKSCCRSGWGGADVHTWRRTRLLSTQRQLRSATLRRQNLLEDAACHQALPGIPAAAACALRGQRGSEGTSGWRKGTPGCRGLPLRRFRKCARACHRRVVASGGECRGWASPAWAEGPTRLLQLRARALNEYGRMPAAPPTAAASRRWEPCRHAHAVHGTHASPRSHRTPAHAAEACAQGGSAQRHSAPDAAAMQATLLCPPPARRKAGPQGGKRGVLCRALVAIAAPSQCDRERESERESESERERERRTGTCPPIRHTAAGRAQRPGSGLPPR
jgi:hypothetical protein